MKAVPRSAADRGVTRKKHATKHGHASVDHATRPMRRCIIVLPFPKDKNRRGLVPKDNSHHDWAGRRDPIVQKGSQNEERATDPMSPKIIPFFAVDCNGIRRVKEGVVGVKIVGTYENDERYSWD